MFRAVSSFDVAARLVYRREAEDHMRGGAKGNSNPLLLIDCGAIERTPQLRRSRLKSR
jgi:hypothetical protein